ncbi:hypothetical protein Pth03_12690 [Planotetraspora thailandica]|uniref:Uncharacterized protein n=1 Tax=Planotetraspora thailandica TaxID=487172 RepID=A0A8J3XU91_9ACTN|nr:hypothetical protein Pth03_12690 [Planotetraspora thailandica]
MGGTSRSRTEACGFSLGPWSGSSKAWYGKSVTATATEYWWEWCPNMAYAPIGNIWPFADERFRES